MLKIGGIDPGLASGGFVVIDAHDQDRVLKAFSLVEKKGDVQKARKKVDEISKELFEWSDKQFSTAALRAERWMERIEGAIDEFESEFGRIDYFGVESFVDQASKARAEKAGLLRNRWQTPLTTGYLAAALAQRGYTVANGRLIYQNAGVVIPQMREQISMLEKGRARGEDRIIKGDSQVTNDHLRKALAHALALSVRVKRKERAV